MLARSTACRQGRADLPEGRVDQPCGLVADQDVGRLDVAVGHPRHPHPVDDLQRVVDQGLVDLDVADLLASLQELGDQHVLRLGVSSTNPSDLAVGIPASLRTLRM